MGYPTSAPHRHHPRGAMYRRASQSSHQNLISQISTAEAFAEADILELEEDLQPTGFYRKKAQTVQSMCRVLVERFGSEVPPTMEQLTTLPGVARKTANVVLNCAFNIPSGIIVDTHVARVSPRLGLSKQKNADKIEQDLMKLVPQQDWTFFGPAVVLHGRYICSASSPQMQRVYFGNCLRTKYLTSYKI